MRRLVPALLLGLLPSTAAAQLDRYHTAIYDAQGKLVPWGLDAEGPYHSTMELQAEWWVNAPDLNGWPTFLTDSRLLRSYAQINSTALPASTAAKAINAYLKWWAYTGDARWLAMCRRIGDYVVQQTLTPPSFAGYPSFPYAQGAPGDITPDGSGEGSTSGVLHPDKGAMLGVALLRLWQATGNTVYRDNAIHFANVLADRATAGSDTTSPWPFKVVASTGGLTVPAFPLCGNQSFALRLYDELIRLGIAGNGKYPETRALVWSWLRNRAIPDTTGMLWQHYFEDISTTQTNRTQFDALETARYLLEKKEQLDPQWFELAGQLIQWVRAYWIVHSGDYTAIAEQEVDRSPYNSHTARYASILAMYHEAGGPAADRDEAYSSFAYSTYSVDFDGFADTNYSSEMAWTTDSFGDWMHHFMDGIAAVPAWAPPRQNHLLRSSSVPQSVSYAADRVAYTTFDASTDVLRLAFAPGGVTADGAALQPRNDLAADGYTLSPLGNGDYVVRVRHAGRAVVISTAPAAGGPPPSCPVSVFGAAVPPASSSDANPYELGVKLGVRAQASITGIRFYKAPQNTGTHLGRIWSSTGQLLASTTFTGEAASGWQTASIGPVAVSPGTPVVASVTYPNGGFSYEIGGLTNRAGNPDGLVYALADGEVGPNGVFRSGTGFPTTGFARTSYFVDVVVADAAPINSPSGLSAPAPTATAVTLAWTPGTEGNAAAHRHLITRDGSFLAATAGTVGTYTDSAVAAGSTYTYAVQAEDFCGNLSSPATVMVTTPSGGGAAPETVFGNASPASGLVSGDGSAVQMGVKLRAAVEGRIGAVRFWRDVANPGGYTVNLWSANGTLLASAAGAGGATPGWQEIAFSSPVPVTAGTTYVASYHSSNGRFRYTPRGLESRITGGNLTLLSSAESGGNGVYAYGAASTFPAFTYDAANYWVDVRFTAGSGGSAAVNVFGSATPNATLSPDTAPVEVGVRVRSTSAGTVDAIRFFRQASGTFTVNLWTANGALLGSGTGSAGTVPGWQETRLATPVNISAGTTYVASYHAPGGRFSYTPRGLASSVTSGPLTALADGVYRYGAASGFPAQTYDASNYWVDVRFTPGAAPASQTIYGDAAPSGISGGTGAYWVGLRFQSAAAGTVSAIRFFRQVPVSTPETTAALWGPNGTLLASATVPSPTGSGWVEVPLSSPVAIAAGATYTAAYHVREFPYRPRGRAQPSTSGDLTALADGGVYAPAASPSPPVMPAQSYDAYEYFVDVRFSR